MNEFACSFLLHGQSSSQMRWFNVENQESFIVFEPLKATLSKQRKRERLKTEYIWQ